MRLLRDGLACVFVGILIISALEVRSWVKAQPWDAVIANASSATLNADELLASSRKPVALILTHADEAVGESARTAKHVATVTQGIADQQQAVADKTIAVMDKTAATVETINEQVGQVGEQARITLSQAEIAEKSLGFALDDVDKRVNDPEVLRSFENISLVTGSFADLSSDAVKVERKYFFPAPYAGQHKVLHRIGVGAYTGLKLLGPFAEAAYYGSNIK